MGRFDQLDLSLKLSKDEEAERLEAGGKRLQALRLALGAKLPGYGLGPPVCVLFEGWDASGKGGAIKRLVAPLDTAARARGAVRGPHAGREAPPLPVALLAEAARLGRHGGVRSHLVRARAGRAGGGLRDAEQWRRAYGEIVELERTLHAEGMVLIKFFMHLSEEEQLKRFEERRDNPLKSWKLTPDDWENRRKRPQYTAATEEMLERTDHEAAPVGCRRGREQEVRAREGRRDGHRAHRGRDARACASSRRPRQRRAPRVGRRSSSAARGRAWRRGRAGWTAGSAPTTGSRTRCIR